jgi:hypothetical protein
MKRVAVLREDATAARRAQITTIRKRFWPDLEEQARCFRDVVKELTAQGIHLVSWNDLSPAQKSDLHFDWQVSPALTPLLIEPGMPFPFLKPVAVRRVPALRPARPRVELRPDQGPAGALRASSGSSARPPTTRPPSRSR